MILMSKKTNHTSNLFHATLEDHDMLADTDLDAVTGGTFTSYVKGESTEQGHKDWVII
jgi:hypothetical protein